MSSRQRLVILLGSGCALSLVGCVVLAYLWIDRSISLAYARQSVETSTTSLKRLESLLGNEWLDMPRDQVLQKLEREVKTHASEGILLKKDQDDSVVWLDEIPFYFESGRLRHIGGPGAK